VIGLDYSEILLGSAKGTELLPDCKRNQDNCFVSFSSRSLSSFIVRSMVLDIDNISDDELPDIFPTTQGIS